MYKRILVPLDGSPRAEAIFPHVESLAHSFGSKVILLQVIEPANSWIIPPDAGAGMYLEEIRQREEETAQSYLNGKCGEFSQKSIDTEYQIMHGPVVASILEVAAQRNADLIAMASHGRTGLSRVFYGSVAAGVLHRADRPLLLVRADSHRL